MATDVDTGGHVWFACSRPCDVQSCSFCDGGLARCTICGAAEGELLSHCPGFWLNQETKEACYNGNVLDFTYLRRLSRHSPETFREELIRLNKRLSKSRGEVV